MMDEKRLVLCSAIFDSEDDARSFGKNLDQRGLTYVICENRLTLEYTGEDWVEVIRLFESLPRRSIVAKFEKNTLVNCRI